jgi:transposase
MLYVGLDIHSKHITFCVLGDRGKVVRRGQVRTIDEIMRFLTQLPERCEICYEASCGYGHYYDLLRPLATRVVVVHPGQLRLIFRSKHKNDRKDAERLAKLLYLGEAPAIHVPGQQVRAWREMILYRERLIAKRTRAKNGLRALLRSVAIHAPRSPGLWTRRGMAWLRELPLPTTTKQLQRDLLCEEVVALAAQVRRVEGELSRWTQTSPAVAVLTTIPGVGVRTAEAVAAFLDDPSRFARSKQVGKYFGLVPCQDQSGDTNRLGHITREGPAVVRRLLTEAVWQARRRSPTVRAYFERVQRQDPERKKIAVVATAHYLARVMYALLKHGTCWQESERAA